MSKTFVMTVRLPRDLGLGVKRYSAQTGHKPAKVGTLAVDEFLRRRTFPLIDFRESAVGRVAYVKGTRLAVYWPADVVKRLRGNIKKAAETWEISTEKVSAALHYAEEYPQEIKAMQDRAQAARALLEKAEAARAKAKALGESRADSKPKPKTRR
jgi:uncharacterized protein (DUF433 family)